MQHHIMINTIDNTVYRSIAEETNNNINIIIIIIIC